MLVRSISLNEAKEIIDAAELKAVSLKKAVSIAIVDWGGNLVSQIRMDGAWIGSIELARDKAFTARAFEMPTEIAWKLSQPGNFAFGVQSSHGGKISTITGGFPLIKENNLIGAIGVSGADPEADEEIAKAGIEAF